MDVCSSNLSPYWHISLPYITNFVINANHQRSQPALRHVSICGVSPSDSSLSSYVTYWMLLHAYATSPGKAKWSGPHQPRWEDNEFKFHSVTCYINSMVSHFHVNTKKLCNITCTLVDIGVILWSLEFSDKWTSWYLYVEWMWQCKEIKINIWRRNRSTTTIMGG